MKRIRIAVVSVLALALAGLSIPAPAAALGTGTVTVQLVTVNGAPLSVSGIFLQLYHEHDGTDSYFDSEGSNLAGAYTFTGVPSSTSLVVRMVGTSSYISNTKSGVSVGSGHSISTTITAIRGAMVSGTVTQGSTPLSGANVLLLDSHNNVAGGATTDGSGLYLIQVKAGTYRVQFNSRQLSDAPAAQNFTWSYWKNTTSWTSAKTITVKQQSKSHVATIITGINGSVSNVASVNGDVELTGITGTNAVEFVGTHPADTFWTQLSAGGAAFSSWVNPGKYRIAVQGNLDPILGVRPMYWYRGDTTGVTADESKATWVTVTASETDLHFIVNPPPS